MKIFVPSAARKTRAEPAAPCKLFGVNITVTSLPTGYSITDQLPSAFWTTAVLVVVVVVVVLIVGSCASAKDEKAIDNASPPLNLTKFLILIKTSLLPA